MKKPRYRFRLSFALALLALSLFYLLSAARPAAPARRNFASHYLPGHLASYDTRREGDSLRIFLRFGPDLQSPTRRIQVAAWPDYDARQPLWRDSVRVEARGRETARLFEVALPVSRLQPGQVLSLTTSLPGNENNDGAWVPVTAERLARTFVVIDSAGTPLLRRNIRVGEVFRVSNYSAGQTLTGKQYTPDFAAALPPMTNPALAPPVARTMAVRDSFAVQTGRLVKLAGAGLYILRVSGNSNPLGLLALPGRYPEVTTAGELIEPLLYLTSSAERQSLAKAPDAKRAVDRFWLDRAADQQSVARQLIRTYYGRVADANRLFTAHKEGWMTDRGMLYVVYGPPAAVYRTGEDEQWVYQPGTPGYGTYVFRAKPSTFAPDNYDLVRRPEYEKLWYAAVEQWRNATTAPTAR